MKTGTKYFGEVSYEQENVMTFPRGLYGFEDEKEYLMIPFKGGENVLFCLQSVRTPQLAFIMVDPFSFYPAYQPVFPEEDLRELGVEKSGDLFVYALCIVKEPVGESTVNLRCPIAINGDTCVGLQAVLEDDRYQMRHTIRELSEKGDEEVC